MHHAAIRRIAIGISIFATAASVGLWALVAAPAGATGHFSPLLKPTTSSPKVAASEVAAYNATAAAKRATVIKTTRKASPKASAKTTTVRRSTSRTSELSRARSILASNIRRYPILRGTTVEFGDAKGYQAIAYYRSGRIVISRSHTASLERILNHEVWHVIDWRDNGRIDWGENVPR